MRLFVKVCQRVLTSYSLRCALVDAFLAHHSAKNQFILSARPTAIEHSSSCLGAVCRNPSNKSNYFCFSSKGRCLFAHHRHCEGLTVWVITVCGPPNKAAFSRRIHCSTCTGIGYFSGFVNYFLVVTLLCKSERRPQCVRNTISARLAWSVSSTN